MEAKQNVEGSIFKEELAKLHEALKEFEGNQTVENYIKIQHATDAIEYKADRAITEYID